MEADASAGGKPELKKVQEKEKEEVRKKVEDEEDEAEELDTSKCDICAMKFETTRVCWDIEQFKPSF